MIDFRKAATILAFALSAAGISAHPHVFITNRMLVTFDGSTLSRIDLEWTFDELFSSTIIADYDQNRNGKFEPKEASELRIGAFDNLSNYHYFVALFLDGKAITMSPIRDFKPSISGNRLVYRFGIPLKVTIGIGERHSLGVTLYDDSYYSAFDRIHPADVVVEKSAGVECLVSIEKTIVKASWPGQYMPDQVVLRMKGAPKP
jgi:ABC-type uncharacterized transport system substrate-binding protein